MNTFSLLWIIFVSSPFMFGLLTKTDVSLLPFISSIIILIVYKAKVDYISIMCYFLGLFGILIAEWIHPSSSVLKGIIQFTGPFVYILALRAVLSRIPFRNVVIAFNKVLRCIFILYICSLILPGVAKLLSSILFINRVTSVEFIGRTYTTFLGEPSFSALIAMFFLLIVSIRKHYLDDVKLSTFYIDVGLALISLFGSKAGTAIVSILVFAPFFVQPIRKTFSNLVSLKLSRAFVMITFLLAIVLMAVFYSELSGSTSRFSSIIYLLVNEDFSIINLVGLDQSVAQRFLNIDIFLSSFPFDPRFVFGSSVNWYASHALDFAKSSSLLDYSSLYRTGYPYTAGQVSAVPILYFNYGILPIISLCALIFLPIANHFNKMFSTTIFLSSFLFLIICLFSGPSILFPPSYIAFFIVIYAEYTIQRS